MASSCLAIVGLGYVGLPVAVAFGKTHKTIGFDISEPRIKELKSGHDSTLEVDDNELKSASKLEFTADQSLLRNADVIIVCVPTPVDAANKPDFAPLIKASETVGKNLKSGAIIVYESTVYPGATEDICIPVLERVSGKKWKKDFFVGYSPERINPGDKQHTLTTVKKVVAGDTPETLATLSRVYGSIITAGVHEAESIKVAEAAKIIENTQRDINIALINECSMIFHRMGIDTKAVLDAAGTKWNFLGFRPGLVGGHCIGVDPYYLTHKAEMLGHHPRVILSGRAINDGMGKFIAEQTVKTMLKNGIQVRGSKVAVMGLTFKEDVPDLRNSKVIDVIRELQEYGVECFVHDVMAHSGEAREEYGVDLIDWKSVPKCEAVVAAVAHAEYRENGLKMISEKLPKGGVLIDIKSMFDRQKVAELGFAHWRL
jgi:UDP-N-acetyl-D-galactosamine dehydrogenase